MKRVILAVFVLSSTYVSLHLISCEKKKSKEGKGGIQWLYSKPAGNKFTESEITVAQYRACVEAGKCTAPDTGTYCNWGYSDRDNHPVNCVDWNQATSFCEWAGGRLPTEQEWEKEASNSGSRTYPWGDTEEEPTCERVVMSQRGEGGCGRDSTWPVCSKERGNSVSGLCDMSGNVWEWTSSWSSNERKYRVVRGGSLFSGDPGDFGASFRNHVGPTRSRIFLGFRCGRAAPGGAE